MVGDLSGGGRLEEGDWEGPACVVGGEAAAAGAHHQAHAIRLHSPPHLRISPPPFFSIPWYKCTAETSGTVAPPCTPYSMQQGFATRGLPYIHVCNVPIAYM